MQYCLTAFFFILSSASSFGSAADSAIHKTRLIILSTGSAAVYGGSLVYLSKAWYPGDKTRFHFFNDLPQWKQVDKAGHLWTAFHEAKAVTGFLQWTRVPEDKSYLIGSLAGFFLQLPVELLDGYSPRYGASLSDIAANGLGSLLFMSQYLAWGDVRIQPKFSFHTTSLASQRPEVLGESLPEQILKDYNGQTYWLSGNIYSLFHLRGKFPRWINIALGYGAEQMKYGRDDQNLAEGYFPYRQYYLSLDVDFSHVPIKQKWLKVLLYPLNLVHIPFPAIELSRKGIALHPLYF